MDEEEENLKILFQKLDRLAAAIEKQAESTAQAVNMIAMILDVLAGEEEDQKPPPEHL